MRLATLILSLGITAVPNWSGAAEASGGTLPPKQDPPLALRGVTVTSSRWADLSSPGAFARSVFRLERAGNQMEEAEALFRWMERLVMVGPPAFEAGRRRGYCLQAGRILRTHGYSTCDGIGTGLAQIWRSLGREAHKTYMPSRGHTIAEVEYLDSKGKARWGALDAHGAWFARTADGKLAGARELARKPGLVPLRGAWAGYKTPGCVHCDMMHAPVWDPVLSLHPGERVDLLWDGDEECYFEPNTLGSDFRKAFFKKGSRFRKSVGSARFSYKADFTVHRPEEACLPSGVRLEGGVASPAGEHPAVLEYDFPSPYIYTAGAIEVGLRCGPGAAAVVLVNCGRPGRWTKAAEYAKAGEGDEAVTKIDLGADGKPWSIRGRYRFGLRIELRGKASLTSLVVSRRAQFNPRSLPPVQSGRNRFAISTGPALPGWAPRVTLKWQGRDGEEFESRTPKECPHEFSFFAARRRHQDPPVVMRAMSLECVRLPRETLATAGAAEDESGPARSMLALARSGTADSLRKLHAATSHEDPEVRYWAAHGLAEAGAKDAVGRLGKMLLEDRSDRVRMAAANALGIIADRSALPVLLKALESKSYANLSQEKKDTLPFRWLLSVRWVVARALADIGDPGAVKPLIAELKKANSDYTVVLAESLVSLKAREAVPALCARLRRTPRGCTARACAAALGELVEPGKADQQTVSCLLLALRCRSADARRAAIVSLGKLKIVQATAEITSLAESTSDPYIKVPAMRALEAMKSGADQAAQHQDEQ